MTRMFATTRHPLKAPATEPVWSREDTALIIGVTARTLWVWEAVPSLVTDDGRMWWTRTDLKALAAVKGYTPDFDRFDQ